MCWYFKRFFKIRPENAEHCDGFGCVLSWMLWLFSCLHLHGITEYIVVKVEVGKKRSRKSLFQGSVFVMVFVLGAWSVLLGFGFF